ncbi:DUF2062 domain-containing protein [Alphaproteobacteria bacterium KMM 3653]|uniref:DUF2062 domain-containing protein n=1 Tax=Harenicola maris TaxID=2841044 RepID=A0AAP2CRZ0_9RHOB|nr:DUF2062 domain-containing protein [Harenicola maris]
MVFKRRHKRSWPRLIADVFWPRGGWGRAFSYIQHRVRRLPDNSHRIARGIFAGVVVTFTPFYGLHFLVAFILAKLMRGNVLAALLATFIGNPVTFPFIAALSLQTGQWLLGIDRSERFGRAFFAKFGGAMHDLWFNFKALFTPARAEWSHLNDFMADIFLPYLVGGLIPGIVFGTLAYYACEPVIRAYQNRRKGLLRKKLAEMAAKKQKSALKKPPKSADTEAGR